VTWVDEVFGRGKARGELLPKFGDRLVGAFGEFKALFDPDDRMNPGKVVAPNPVDGQLRLGPQGPRRLGTCSPRR
jgi:hypothetical protein